MNDDHQEGLGRVMWKCGEFTFFPPSPINAEFHLQHLHIGSPTIEYGLKLQDDAGKTDRIHSFSGSGEKRKTDRSGKVGEEFTVFGRVLDGFNAPNPLRQNCQMLCFWRIDAIYLNITTTSRKQ